MFELGCVFHSFIIGITLGVNTDDIETVRKRTNSASSITHLLKRLADLESKPCYQGKES
jgi:hypothetical protein